MKEEWEKSWNSPIISDGSKGLTVYNIYITVQKKMDRWETEFLYNPDI